MAHATTDGGEPAAQGIWGIFEVFADTVLLCTLTALVILSSGIPTEGENYMMITIGAYAAVLGEIASCFLALSVLLFGFATVICWAHYGMECVDYLSSSRGAPFAFQLLYSGSVLLGTVWASDGIWQVADLALGLMTLINLPVLCAMSGEVLRVTNVFLNRKNGLKKRGRRDIMRGRSSR
jgi:AGCS family alanine or glycine:cation symporter